MPQPNYIHLYMATWSNESKTLNGVFVCVYKVPLRGALYTQIYICTL